MRLAIIAINVTLIIGMASLITGCGLTQKISEGTVSLTKSIFYKQINTLHLDISARRAANKNAQGVALSTVVRIYQLKERKEFDAANYAALLAEDSAVVKADLLVQKDIRVRPDESISVEIPMEKEANYVAVAAMFLTPDEAEDSWRIVLSRNELDPDTAQIIELQDQQLKRVIPEDK